MNDNMLEYRPSLVGKIARVLIPFLQKSLPAKVYKVAYDALYNSYKFVLRVGYFLKYCFFSIFGSKTQKLKVKLVWKLLKYTMGGRKALENAFEVVQSIESRNIEGALVECGVAEGGTAAMLAVSSNILGNQKRTKWFFDSYEGLPEPTMEDYIGGKVGDFIRPLPKGSCLGTVEQVSELMFDTLKLSKGEVNLVKGWFQDTVPVEKNKIDKIAVLRLDGDWYESTKIPLENFYPKISQGGIIIIDDYGTCFGSKRAVDEFISENKIQTSIHSDGRGGVWFEKPKV